MPNKLQKGLDFIGVTISFFCHDGQGNFIMAKRGKRARDEQGKWDIGGGGLEFGEDVVYRLKQEIKEEYCAEVLKYEFLGYRDVKRKQRGKTTHWISLDFKVKVNPKKVKNGEPHKLDQVRWFNFKTVPKPIHSTWPLFKKTYWQKLKNNPSRA